MKSKSKSILIHGSANENVVVTIVLTWMGNISKATKDRGHILLGKL